MKILTLEPWQFALLKFGRLKVVCLRHECPECGSNHHEPAFDNNLPYTVDDVVELGMNANLVGWKGPWPRNGLIGTTKAKVISVQIKPTKSITEDEAIEVLGLTHITGRREIDIFHGRHPWELSLVIGIEII